MKEIIESKSILFNLKNETFKTMNALRKAITFSVINFVLWQAWYEFYQVAWGTGNWIGEFSRTWAVLLCIFTLVCVTILIATIDIVFGECRVFLFVEYVVEFREKIWFFRWLLWLLVFFAPLWLFQISLWGIVFQKVYFRLFVWMLMTGCLAILTTRGKQLIDWRTFLSVLILTSSLFSVAATLKEVNDYPFSLGWSEGNRLWDYSVMFGRERYDYPLEEDIPVYLDFGRRLIGGLPFLFSGTNIYTARLWVGLIQIFPYLLLGITLFRFESKIPRLLLTFWVFLFLKQGPIHPPLVISAAMIALAWRSSLWMSIPLVLGAGYFAQASRFTWMFAPAMWIFMLEISSASFYNRKVAVVSLKRAFLLAFVGMIGGIFLANLIGSIQVNLYPAASPVPVEANDIPTGENPSTSPDSNTGNTYPSFIQFVIDVMSSQSFLWYRLLPNPTYGNGVLLALFYAVGPLTFILYYVMAKKIWQVNSFQRVSTFLLIVAFFAVGIVASTKIGGGGDLHNLDMFLIAILFAGALAWFSGGREWLLDEKKIPDIIKVFIVLLLVNSSIGPLQAMRSYNFQKDANDLMVLTDKLGERRNNMFDMLPLPGTVDKALQTIQRSVDDVEGDSEILFIDQRQLLTFDYIQNVKLIPEYEKKRLMDEALSNNKSYFEPLYMDLAAHRFSLIISEPLRSPVKDSSFHFGEENNAWVKWVSVPVLCYYEPMDTLQEVGVQLLVPREEVVDCASELP